MKKNNRSTPSAPWRNLGRRWARLSLFVLASALSGMAAVAPPPAQAATLLVVNNDGAGEGFNDPTAAAPVGGNSGTTIGGQRLIAFQHAANIWSGLLSSAVVIRVGAQFDPLTCSVNSAILGSAGPRGVFSDFSGALLASTYYPSALANAQHGSDLDPTAVTGDDISATFSSVIGTTGCLEGSGWYYGLDSLPPAGKIDFVSVLLHELGHGLGFLTFVNLTTGAKIGGLNDPFMRNLENHGAIPADYPSMTDAQRVAASIHTSSLHWTGANVRAASGVLSAGKLVDHVQMYAPATAQPGSSVSHWDTAATPNQVMEPSYTGALHNPVLELPLFQDLGWTLLSASPILAVTPASQDFGSVTVGSFADRSFTVQNTGTGTLSGSASTAAPFSIVSGGAYSLGAGASQVVNARFSPVAVSSFAGNLTFTGGAGATRVVTGSGIAAADLTPPSVPTGLAATPVSTSQINLTWNASTDNVAVTGYKVFRGGVLIASPVGTSFSNSALTASTLYSYTVAACDAATNCSAQSGAVTATTFAPDITPPSIPAGLAATPVSGSQINLTWSASTDNLAVTGYRVFRGGVLVGSPAGTGFIDNGLTPSTLYSYTVAACDAATNCSAQSGAVAATTLAATNVALASQGALATASSTLAGFPVASVNNNERTGGNFSNSLLWSDATASVFPDFVQITFNGAKTIDRVVLYTLQDNFSAPIEPTSTTTFSLYGITGFQVMTWNGVGWDTQATITGNNLVRRSVSFPAVTTARLRINVTSALATNSYITEIEAWTAPDATPPSIPTALAATPVSSSQINLTWAASTDNVGVTGYKVFRGGVLIANPVGASFSDSALTASTLYSYTVAACDAAANCSAQSGAVTATTLAVADVTPPSVPTGLVATPVSSGQINLTWNPSSDNVAVTGYRVFRGGVLVGSPAGPGFSNSGLAPSTLYSYTVSACDAASNCSAQSGAATATTPAPPVMPSINNGPPPGGTVGVAYSFTFTASGTAPISWNVASGALPTGLGLSPGTGVLSGTPTVPGLFTFSINAANSAGGSVGAFSITVAAGADLTPPSIPTGLAATPVSSSQINLTWNASTDNVAVTGYRVFRGGVQIASPAGTSFSDSGLTASTLYSYTVAACDAATNCSAQSGAATATTSALADDGFPSGGAIPAGWTQPAGSNAAWVVNNITYRGPFSLKSGTIADSQKSEITYSANFQAGNVSFARKISSELNFDFLEFYIDGVLQTAESGELDWALFSFPVSAGTHVLLWRYTKDASVSFGGDAAWIDAVTLPAVAAASGNNVALASSGAIATASSTLAGFPVASVNNGERTGGNFSNSLLWADATPSVYPDWVQITFNGTKTIDRVVLYTVQDNFTAPIEPTDALTFSQKGITAFTVQTWNGSIWVTQATIMRNNLVKRSVTFAPVTTDRIRINVTLSTGGTAYITEIEAFTPAVADPTAPSVPTGLVATPVSSSQINLSWTASTDNVAVTGYKVFRGGVLVANPAGTSFSDSSLAASTLYSYTVAACDAAANCSAQSGAATATTSAPSATPPIITSGPPPASGTAGSPYTYTFTASSSTAVTWTVASGSIPTGLVLAAGGLLSGTPTLVGTFTFTLAATNASGVTISPTYSIAIAAAADATPPSVPAGLAATPASSSQINLTWLAATDNVAVTGYKVFRGGVLIASPAGTSFGDSALAPSTLYSYTVAACDAAANCSAQSGAVAATTLAGSGGSNVALAGSGAIATASSTLAGFPVASVNNNERTGGNFSNSLLWADATPNAYPDWVQITFNGTKTIDRVVLYTVQDNFTAPIEPTDALTFSQKGITAFTVQTWNGSIWVTQATIMRNNLVKRSVTFAPVTTDRIRINVTLSTGGTAYITEIEAWGN